MGNQFSVHEDVRFHRVFLSAGGPAVLRAERESGNVGFKRRLRALWAPRILRRKRGRWQTTRVTDNGPAVPDRAMETEMSTLGIVLIVILILLLVGAVPSWGHSRSWGYGPSGILGVILVIVIILLLMGRL